MQRPVAITAVVIAVLASWTCSRRAPNEQAMIEAEVANGWTLRNDAVPSTLTEAERKAFALVPDATYLKPDLPPEEWYADWRGVVPGGAAWDVGGDVRSPWAVWTTRALLSARECGRDVKSRHSLGLPDPPEASFSAIDSVSQALRLYHTCCVPIWFRAFGQPWTISHFFAVSRLGAPRGSREQKSCSSKAATLCLLAAAGASRESTRAPGGTARHVWLWTRVSRPS